MAQCRLLKVAQVVILILLKHLTEQLTAVCLQLLLKLALIGLQFLF